MTTGSWAADIMEAPQFFALFGSGVFYMIYII
jgi:hypothetical protein